MAFAYARLTEITTIATSAGSLYANPSGTTTYIRMIVLHNANTTAEEVKLYNVPDNAASVGTAAETNLFYDPPAELAAGDTKILEFPAPGVMLVDENDTIQGLTDTVSKVTFQMYGATE